MEPKPATLTEALNRMRDTTRTTEQHFHDFADALEIIVILGDDTDARDLDRDITDFRK